MATFSNYEDTLKTCPYNRVHKVAARRYQQHVAKCAKTALVKLQECPFNNVHRIPPHEYKKHCMECPDGHQTIREIVETSKINAEQAQIRKPFQPNPPEEDTYDPWSNSGPSTERYTIPTLNSAEDMKKYEEGTEVKYMNPLIIQRMTPAERRRYYDRQVELQKIKIENDAAASCSTSAKIFEDGEIGDHFASFANSAGSTMNTSDKTDVDDEAMFFAEHASKQDAVPKPRGTIGGVGRGRGAPPGLTAKQKAFAPTNIQKIEKPEKTKPTNGGSNNCFLADDVNDSYSTRLQSIKQEQDSSMPPGSRKPYPNFSREHASYKQNDNDFPPL